MCTVEDLYHESYAVVDQAICYDEVNHQEGALEMYERGLALIDQAGQLPGAQNNPLYKKMVGARDHVISRLEVLRAAQNNTETELQQAIDSFAESKMADELFIIPGGVQIFMIEGDDVAIPQYPTSLKIFKFRVTEDDDTTSRDSVEERPPAFLQVGDWMYPLVPGRMPSLHANWGAYVFPNPTVDQPDLYVGLILPADLDDQSRTEFMQLLRQYTQYREQTPDSTSQLSEEEKKSVTAKIAYLLIAGGEAVAWGVQKGADKTNKFVSKKSDKYRTRLNPEATSTNISPRLQTSVHYLRKGTKNIAAYVNSPIQNDTVDAIGEAAVRIGQAASKKIEKRLGGSGTTGGSVWHGTVEVASGAVAGAATVWMALEEAAEKLGKHIANETVLTVAHKYGEEAGKLADNAMHAAGHGAMTGYNLSNLGPKAIAKRTAKKAGLAMLKDLTSSKSSKPEAIEAPPDQGTSGAVVKK